MTREAMTFAPSPQSQLPLLVFFTSADERKMDENINWEADMRAFPTFAAQTPDASLARMINKKEEYEEQSKHRQTVTVTDKDDDGRKA